MMIHRGNALVLAAVAAVCSCSCVMAAPVGTNEVARAMRNWRHRYGTLETKLGESVGNVRKVVHNGTAFHVVRFEGGGHAIVPTDTKLRPVLMFSGADDFVLDECNPALALIMADIKAESARRGVGLDAAPGASAAAAPRSRNENEWADLLDDNLDAMTDYKSTLDDVRVGPLLTTKWAQGNLGSKGKTVYYCYDYYTPNHYVCGCVATALAQTMNYFEWPKGDVAKFTSQYTQVDGVVTPLTTQGGSFNWANMVDSPTSSTSDTKRRAIGKLMSDVGIIIGMGYAEGGSSAYTSVGRYALTQTVLGYSNAIAYENGEKNGSEEDFSRVMISNFNAKRPVQLGVPGHAIVGDGYGYNGGKLYYHLNMGWGGVNDYWYAMPVSATDYFGGDSDFTCFKTIVYNIFTDESPDNVILSGRVTEGGYAAKSMPVVALTEDGIEVANAVTDTKGIYAMLVPPGTYTVVVSKDNGDGKTRKFGQATGTALECVTVDVTPEHGLNWTYGTPTMGNCADCDIEVATEAYPPEATVSVGEATMLTNFASATIPVTVKVAHYGATAQSANVIVTLTPVGGGTAVTREFSIAGDFNEHTFNAAFDDLTAGGGYVVTAQVKMGSEEAKAVDDGFSASRKIKWFNESAVDFTPAKWTGGEVKAENGRLTVTSSGASPLTFTPDANANPVKRIDISIFKGGAFTADTIPAATYAGVSAIVRQNGQAEVVVAENGAWQPTGVFLSNENLALNVVIELDFAQHSVRYSSGSAVLGTYALPTTVANVSAIAFEGTAALSEFSGLGQDANLVRAVADGTEYATFGAARSAGATGVLEPLWLSTWDLGDVSGFVEVNDPKNLIVFTGASEIIDNEPLGGDTKRVWFANKKDIEAGAKDYIGTTKELGLTKPISTNSVMKIDDFVVANGAMSFKVEIDDVEIAKEKVKEFIEVCDDLVSWDPPNPENIDFDPATHFITVTPPPGDSYFTRIKIPEDPVK